MQTYCTLMGYDFVLEFDWTLTHKGSRPSGLNGPPEYSDPGSDPEWEIDRIWISLDRGGHISSPAFEATGELFDVLAALPQIDEVILEHIWEHGCDEDYDDRDYYQEAKDDRATGFDPWASAQFYD